MVNFKNKCDSKNSHLFHFSLLLIFFNKVKIIIISNFMLIPKLFPFLDMNAGTVQCKCGVHYTARDPHTLWISEESSSPANEGLGSPQDANDKLESSESPGISRSGSSGEDLILASHSGGEARITNLETGLSSLQTSLIQFNYFQLFIFH